MNYYLLYTHVFIPMFVCYNTANFLVFLIPEIAK